MERATISGHRRNNAWKQNQHEGNSFATSRQLMNVYGKPENRYEVRSEDNAVDV